ncbi:hypothetical protein, partial [Thomasclavelia ramosa]
SIASPYFDQRFLLSVSSSHAFRRCFNRYPFSTSFSRLVGENHQFKPQYQIKVFYIKKKHQKKIADVKQDVNVLKRGISYVKSGVVKSYQTIRKTGKGVQLFISAGTGFLLITTVVLFFGVFSALAGDSGTHSAT